MTMFHSGKYKQSIKKDYKNVTKVAILWKMC